MNPALKKLLALALLIGLFGPAAADGIINPGGTLTPGQLPGTSTNDSASAGNVGEYISSTVAVGSAVSLTTVTTANVTSISLTAGDWDVWGVANYTGGATTTVNRCDAGIGTTSATLPTPPGMFGTVIPGGIAAIGFDNLTVSIMPDRVSLASTTTFFMSTQCAFGTSTLAAYGKLIARRRR
jgi:hypothetical protein